MEEIWLTLNKTTGQLLRWGKRSECDKCRNDLKKSFTDEIIVRKMKVGMLVKEVKD